MNKLRTGVLAVCATIMLASGANAKQIEITRGLDAARGAQSVDAGAVFLRGGAGAVGAGV